MTEPDRQALSNFLATDEVPDSIFGIPVVSREEDYTEADLAFFQEHPEAGGYYDLGEDADPSEPPEEPPPDGGMRAAENAGVPDPPARSDTNGTDDIRELWNRAVKSTGDLNGLAYVFAAMTGESSLNQRGATSEQISNGHLARLLIHANETDRYNGNPANSRRRTVLDTVKRTSHVLSKYKWGTGPGANWFDVSKMEPRFDLIDADPVASKTARDLIMNSVRFLNGDLSGGDRLPSDAISYGDGPNGLMSDREEIKPTENRIGPMPRGFRIGRKKRAK